MSSGMPELGSKINIITKADIRYEGRLFTVDPEKCTIALANVRSYGTEDRETLAPVPPQNQIYDYILFRGRDIKDIGYINNVGPLPNDPAIVQLSVPPSIGSTSYQTPSYSLPVMGHMGTGLPQYPTSYGSIGVVQGMTPMALHDPRSLTKQQSELTSSVPVSDPSTTSDLGTRDDMITSSSRSTTPSLQVRKSPTTDQGVQTNQQSSTLVKDDVQQLMPPQARQIQPPHPARDGRLNNRGPIGPQPPREQRDRDHQVRDQQPLHPRDHRDHREPRDHRDHRDQRDQRDPRDHRDQQMALPQRMGQQQRGGWMNRGVMRRRGGRGNINFNRSQGSQQMTSSQKTKNTLKFENDYDFEQANTEFDKLMSQLVKTKIAESEPVVAGDGKVNGDSVDKKDDSGNETGIGECDPDESQEIFYDKAKSFFDNISCEAVERSKGRSQRTDWRTERKLNSETFGVASARRGGYRARGYYNRGMGRGMYRGNNYRGGPRGGGRGNNLTVGVGMQGRPMLQGGQHLYGTK